MIKVWDSATGQETLTLRGNTKVRSRVLSVAFSPDGKRSDGKRIVSGSDDHTIKVWDSATGQETLTLEGHTDEVNSVAFSPDGKRIASGSMDKTIKVWDGSLSADSENGKLK
jgi:WD40 repeat protein